MADYYDTGTVSVAAGLRTVTGTLTSWAGLIKAGDTLEIGGRQMRVASVESGTSLTLLLPAPAAASGAYAIWYTAPSRTSGLQASDDMRRLIAASEILMPMRAVFAVSSASLNAPPATPVTGDTYLISTAPTGAWLGRAGHIAQWSGTGWAYTAPEAGMRAFVLGDGTQWHRNAAAWVVIPGSVSALGVSGNIGDAVAGTIADARLPSRLQSANNIATDIASSFGGYIQAATDFDYNAAPEGFRGLVAVAANKLNQPPSVTSVFFWYLECQRMYTGTAGVAIRQVATAYLGSAASFPFQFIRISNTSGVWSPWRPVLGQTGATAQGVWTQYADGRMICNGRLSVAADITTAQDSIFRTASMSLTYPATFVDIPSISMSVFLGSNPGIWPGWMGPSATASTYYLFGSRSFPAAAVQISYTATGRWYL